MELAANEYYFGDDAALIPNVIVKYFADPTTMSNEAIRLMDVEGVNVMKVDAPALRYMVFNHTYMVEAE